MPWKAPKTKTGKPCKRCKPGEWCPAHRASAPKRKGGGASAKRTKSERGTYRLTRAVLDHVRDALQAGATTEAALIRAAGIHFTTWVNWRDQGAEDYAKARDTIFRELYEVIHYHRRGMALHLDEAAYDAAVGHKQVIKHPKTGKPIGIYETSPDGRLAERLAGRLYPGLYADEKHILEHTGEVPVVLNIKADLSDIDAAAKKGKRRADA